MASIDVPLSTFTDDTSYGTYVWNNPTYAAADDATSATAGKKSDVTSHYLKGVGQTNLSFLTPAHRIDGIAVNVKCQGWGTFASVKMVKLGTISGSDLSTGAALPGSTTTVVFGGATQKWGLGWTPADLKDLTTGCVFAADIDTHEKCYVDYMYLTVYYTPPIISRFRRRISFLG